MSDDVKHGPQDLGEQLGQLREQVQSLINERIGPALSQAADTAQECASQVRDFYDYRSAALSERVRESPIMAILVAAGVGYVLGRISR